VNEKGGAAGAALRSFNAPGFKTLTHVWYCRRPEPRFCAKNEDFSAIFQKA
jgi:hypothetical protein